MPVYADTIVKKNFREVITTEGLIGSDNWVPFKPSVSGIVTQVLVKAGQKVEKDQVMLVLEHESQAAGLATAKAKAQEARLEASRYQFLADEGAAPREQAEEKKIDAISTQSAYVKAKVELSHRYIKAPFDGIVAADFVVNVGTYVEAGKPILGLLNNDELVVTMNVPAVQAKSLALGQAVRIYSEGSDTAIAKGEIDYISPGFKVIAEGNDTWSPTNTLTVKASFPNAQAGLKPSQLLRSEIQIGAKNLPAIPTSAITMKAQQPFVFKLVPVKNFLDSTQLDEKQSKPLKLLPANTLIVLESPVEIDELQDNQFSVLKGLRPGDKVAISQIKILSSGMPVTVLPSRSAK